MWWESEKRIRSDGWSQDLTAFNTAHGQKRKNLISKTQHNSVSHFPNINMRCDGWRLWFHVTWGLGDAAAVQSWHTGGSDGELGAACWLEEVAAGAEGRWCSLLEGVFSVSAQRGITGLHCQHMPLMLQVLKRNIKRIYPWCWDLFYFCLMLLQIIYSAPNCVCVCFGINCYILWLKAKLSEWDVTTYNYENVFWQKHRNKVVSRTWRTKFSIVNVNG